MLKILTIIFISTFLLNAKETPKYTDEIHNAVRSNNIEILNHTIKKFKSSINKKDKFGFTPLHLAVRINDIKIVEELLKYKVEVNTKDNFGDTPLIESARINNMEILKLLICKGANKDEKNNQGQNVMNFISINKQYEVALFIQEPQCGEDITDKKKQLIDRLRELE